MNTFVDGLIEAILANKGGTIGVSENSAMGHWFEDADLSRGYMVSLRKYESRVVNPTDLDIEITAFFENLDDEIKDEMLYSVDNVYYLGVWITEENGKPVYYFDVSEHIQGSKEQAMNAGLEEKQIAIYDIANKEVIQIESI